MPLQHEETKYFSLFSGIGGFELGIERAIHNRPTRKNEQTEQAYESSADAQSEHTRQLTARCVGFSEIDKYAVSIYQHHFPTHKNYGDITTVASTDLPDHDLLVGGFPCQAFSIAGKRGGFSDTRGTLFFEIARVLKHKRPRFCVLENVKGLLSHNDGRTFTTIISTLDELGYDLGWQVLNSKNHGVPQNRERVFIVGHTRGTPRPQVFPFGADDGEITDIQGHNANTLTARYYGAEATGTYIEEGELDAQEVKVVGDMTGEKWDRFHESSRRVYGTDGISPTIPTSAGGGHVPKIVEKDNRVFDGRIRRLTPTECERLQGFPAGWTEGVSDTQRYKCLGNAVTVNVIEAIMTRLLI